MSYVNKTIEYSVDEVNEINIYDENTFVEISISSDDKIRIDYSESKNEYYDIDIDANGILSVKKQVRIRSEFFFFKVKRVKVNLSIPKDFNKNIRIYTSNASITASDTIFANLFLKTSNAKINLLNVDVINSLDAMTSNSQINLSNVKSEVINCKTSNARISLNYVDVSKKLICKTSNSAVRGEVAGKINDFSIKSKTSNGSSTLPSNMELGDKIMDIKTSNSSININFVEKKIVKGELHE